jgi:hypothetical protein
MADTVVVVDNGLGVTTKSLLATSIAAACPHHIGWGTSVTTRYPASAADASLGTERAEVRVAGTDTQTNTGGTTNDTFQVVGTLTAAGTDAAVTEVGLFDSVAGGTDIMYLHGTFSVINVPVGSSIVFTIRATYNQA